MVEDDRGRSCGTHATPAFPVTCATAAASARRRGRDPGLRGKCPVGQIIIGGLLAIGGALASQITGVLRLAGSGRRRNHDAAARRAADREAKRRQLYEELLRTLSDAQLSCAEMSEACSHLDQKQRALGGVPDDLAERLVTVRTVAVA